MTGCGTARLVVDIPCLAGANSRLRPWRAADAPVLAAAWRDPAIRDRLRVPQPADEAAAARWISQRERACAEGRSADLAVTDLPSGEVIGEVGLSRFDPARRAALIGWWIAAGWRGHRRAAEAVRLVLDWVLTEGPLDAVMAEIDPDNAASAAVARRAGMRRVDASRGSVEHSGDATVLVFARTRDEVSV
jgi:RimJ/RimL family protein N-acetyltransferase